MLLQVTSAFSQAIRSIKAGKLRSLLTMLGIIIGVGSVITMLTVGQGAQRLILAEIEGIGSNLVFLISGPAGGGASLQLTVSNDDIEYVRRYKGQVPSLKRIAGYSTTSREQMQVGSNPEVGVGVMGVEAEYFPIMNIQTQQGLFWSKEDELGMKKVAILGTKARDNIFGKNPGPLLGEKIKLKGQTYQIVGVLQDKGSSAGNLFGGDTQENIFVPLKTAQKLLLGSGEFVRGAMLEAKNKGSIESLQNEITEVLRRRHKIKEGLDDDFQIANQEQFSEIVGTTAAVFTLFLSAIAGISLIVGGIGIMNIMLVVVTERTREIGLRKAIGAKRTDILVQFLIEALIITGIGGLIGIVFGLGVAYAISYLGDLEFALDMGVILMAFGVSSVFGVFFGMYPANKASKLDPIAALRS